MSERIDTQSGRSCQIDNANGKLRASYRKSIERLLHLSSQNPLQVAPKKNPALEETGGGEWRASESGDRKGPGAAGFSTNAFSIGAPSSPGLPAQDIVHHLADVPGDAAAR